MSKRYKLKLIKTLKASINIKEFNKEFTVIRAMYLNDELTDDEFKEAVSFYFLIDDLVYQNIITEIDNRKRITPKEYRKLKKKGKIDNVSVHTR
ncbi:hypothetical protein AB6F65_23065 [Providencia hangzhouensis]|uniref:hypothetical protein n=1 Tax=Providencia hangzhouensis TaxID=3031799 RepID=UPI0034DDAE22